MLETLYNFTTHAELRFEVLAGIINIASKHNITKSILNLTAIKSEAFQAICIDSQRQLFVMLHKALKDSFKKEAYEYLLHYLYTFTEPCAEAQELAKQAIFEAVSIPEVFNFESLTQAHPVQKLSGQPIHELAMIFLNGDVASYKSFIKKHCDIASSFDQAAGLHKMRLLTVTSLGAEYIGSPISYSALAEAMLLEAEDINSEVELYIIDVIRAGLIEAKLNQLEGSIVITRSTHRSFDKSQWQKLHEEFTKWNNSLETVAKTVQSAIEQTSDSSKPSLPLVTAGN
ncbi:hypothetical protein DSO57_1039546 [Entomophthora muscae]|nr:hypothetical protein DSO57_1039546 [Entomophthora muscae]